MEAQRYLAAQGVEHASIAESHDGNRNEKLDKDQDDSKRDARRVTRPNRLALAEPANDIRRSDFPDVVTETEDPARGHCQTDLEFRHFQLGTDKISRKSADREAAATARVVEKI